MSAQPITAESVLSREHLRTFHLTGLNSDESDRIDGSPHTALRPSILASLSPVPDLETCYPMCVHPDGGAQPLRETVRELEHASIITSAFRTAMHGRPYVSLDEAAPSAIASLLECPEREIERLRQLLPPGAYLVAFHAESLVLLHAAALAKSHKAQRERFWEEVRHVAARLREVLLLDETHAPGAVSADSVSASLGTQVSAFFKPSLLATLLQRPANPLKRMDGERRSRCEKTLAILEKGLLDAARQPALWLFHSGIFGSTTAPAELAGFKCDARFAVDTFSAAVQFCDTRLERLTLVLRALRVARLEIDSAFDATIHEEMLARFDWQAASRAELSALPPVVVIETAEFLSQASLTSFGKTLRSGRPVQVLIVRPGIEAQDLREFAPDFGHIAIAHRECFVLQSAMAQPSHLLPGLESMAKRLRPAVAVIAVPGNRDQESAAWLEESLMVSSRTYPLYSYDPDAGSGWRERFQLENPAKDQEDLTGAHASAVSKTMRAQFRIIPQSDWNSEQMEIKEYLEAYTDRPPLAIPYIWVEGANGTQQRALLTRDLVNFCVDRRRAWSLFEELAAIPKPTCVSGDDARKEGARDAIQQVIAMLAEA